MIVRAPPKRVRSGVDVADLVAGLVVVVACAGAGRLSVGYGVGTLGRMGPGFFPLALSILGVGLGLLVALRAVLAPRPEGEVPRLRRLAFVGAAFVLFGVAIEPLGLVLTILLTTVVASFADPAARLSHSLALGAGLAAGIWVVFVLLLKLPVPVLPGGA